MKSPPYGSVTAGHGQVADLPLILPDRMRTGDHPLPVRPPLHAPLTLRFGVLTVAGAVTVLALAGLGSRWGWWPFRTGFTLLRWAGYAALAGAALALIGVAVDRARHRAAAVAAGLAIVVGIAAVAVPWNWRRTAMSVPAIHDITTDTQTPPEFVELRDLRSGATNPVEYGGLEVAAQQRAAYPDVQPAVLALAPAAALARARDAADALGWEIVAVDAATGRLEATDRTLWFGFYDDVVVRVTPTAGGSRVDARSLSRVGGSDVGTNARRLRRFMAELKERR
jgi:uncharacterized protein (DUF1499 family)